MSRARRARRRLGSALFERAAQDGKHGSVLVPAGFRFRTNQRLQPEDVDGDLAECARGAVGAQVLITVSETDAPKDIEGTTAREQQMVSLTFEGACLGAKHTSGQIAIACIEVRRR